MLDMTQAAISMTTTTTTTPFVGQRPMTFFASLLHRKTRSARKTIKHVAPNKHDKARSNLIMQLKLNLIAAACENMGIGINGTLPWKLKGEMTFFADTTTRTKDEKKKNVVLMGRRTWEGIPAKFRPLKNRINVVLSSQSLDLGSDVIVCKSISGAFEALAPLQDSLETIWVIGGSSVYKAAMESPNFHLLYLTRVKRHFDCDTFFPPIPDDFHLVADHQDVPRGIQEENGIQYEYLVYAKAQC